MAAVAKLLRTLRSARGVSVEEASADAGIPVARLRRLERGAETLGYVEGRRLAKALDLCQTCFGRFMDAATDREAREAAVVSLADPVARPGTDADKTAA